MEQESTLAAYRATLASLNERIAGSAAYELDATDPADALAEQAHRSKLRRERQGVLTRIGELEGRAAAAA